MSGHTDTVTTKMTDSDARQQLLSALYKRGIDLGTDDVDWAFESQQTKAQLTTWIRECLDPPTLLTKDELDLYQAIQGQGTVDPTPSDAVPLQEFDIKNAIDSLKASTAAIEKHSKTLEAQRGALLAFKDDASQTEGNSSSQNYEQERGRLMFAVDDVLHSTKDQLSEAEKDSTRATTIMKSVVSERLAADDQVFEALEKLTPKVSETKAPPVESTTIDKWTRALAALRVLEAKACLDANLKGFGDRGGQASDLGTPELKVELEDLQNELQTLRDEIESVVQMVIGHEIRDPLLKSVQSLEGHSPAIDASSLDDPNRAVDSNPNFKLRPAVEVSGPATYATQAQRRFCPSLTDSVNTNIISHLDATTAEATSRLRDQHVAAVDATLESLSKSLGEKQREFMKVTDQLFVHSKGSSEKSGAL
ncbi:hypothetical protein FKW77_001580 [Venturia effusa]|uniref:HAUS augmin-like complex subunit 3 N-terminal domain-containing protein n=1 Tax=Venturia effusa TaxID=50376 RepID=A0A517L0S1_9PEZI|nr:hypothetical protein FKW77_001580 [Venturia effusa]